jgi:hypothetical protein
VEALVTGLLHDWAQVASDAAATGLRFSYDERPHRLLHPPLDPALPALSPAHRRFQAGWSMRDVEPAVPLDVRGPAGERLAGGAA